MAVKPKSKARKRAVNVSIPTELAEEARAYCTNMSAVLERALDEEHRAKRKAEWQQKNRKALEAWNRWVEENGLPFEEIRPW